MRLYITPQSLTQTFADTSNVDSVYVAGHALKRVGQLVGVVGGTRGLGLELARFYAGHGREAVITGRDAAAAEDVGGATQAIALALCAPETIA